MLTRAAGSVPVNLLPFRDLREIEELHGRSRESCVHRRMRSWGRRKGGMSGASVLNPNPKVLTQRRPAMLVIVSMPDRREN